MKVVLTALIAGILLSSCATLPPPAALTPLPTLTSLPPTPLPTPLPPLPTPTTSPVIFRDDFETALQGGWDWRGRTPDYISTAAEHGSLRLTVDTGYAYEENLSSLLLRVAPPGDFQIETRLAFVPVKNYQFAGLIIYESKDRYLQAGREMCRTGTGCVGDGLYFDEYKSGVLQPPGVHLAYKHENMVVLRLQRVGNTYTFFMSPDGVVWSRIGEVQSDINPLLVGVFAGQSREDAPPTQAYFDYFQISSVPPVD